MDPITILIAIAAIVALAICLPLNTAWVPTPQDESSRLEPAGTVKTATFNGTSFDMGAGFSPGGVGMPIAAVIKPSAVDRGNADETYTFQLMESSDNVTFTAAGVSVQLATNSTAAFNVPAFISKRYVRLTCTIAGTTPSITYEAWLNANLG